LTFTVARLALTDLAQRGPLGQKAPKQPKAKRKAIHKQSAKRLAYMASAERKAGVLHMGRVAQFGCLVCGAPAEVHHVPNPRSDMRVIPLCPHHHRREYGPGAYHYSPRAFADVHGSDDELLEIVEKLLKALDV